MILLIIQLKRNTKANKEKIQKMLQKYYRNLSRVKNQKIKWANNGNVRHRYKKKERIFENFY